MEKKAIFLDVDGTLVANHGKMTEQVKKAITLARNQGHKVFICTGRRYSGFAISGKRPSLCVGEG